MPMSPQSASATILVVDDEPDLRTLYELTLLREGYRIDTAADVAEAMQQLQAKQFDVVITDMRLPDGTGLQVLQQLRAAQRPERCIVMTAYGSAENAVEALKSGAFDYLTKPVDLKQFRAVVASALRDVPAKPTQSSAPAALGTVAASTTSAVPTAAAPGQPALSPAAVHALQRLVGHSEPMQGVKRRIIKVARSMAPVLVRGESGTGKELVAQALHANSHRAGGPLIAVNCGAIPENLLEAEFFGAKKGAYTGALQDREGYFAAAQDGTLFLDEIGDLPLAMQSKLLRAIQERRVRPLGGTHEIAVDVRIVSATHKDLAQEVKAGRFRQDLYYRLNVIEIVIPPLRDRREDLPALCDALLYRIASESGLPPPTVSDELLQQLARHPLVGNVRELENLLHRAIAMSENDGLHVDFEPTENLSPLTRSDGSLFPEDEAPPAAPEWPPSGPAPLSAGLPSDLQAYLDQQERDILVQALRATGFNRTATAARLGLSLRQIRYRIERLNISAPSEQEPQDE
ncbi:sigma-54-dependent transcriptional regulator [Variovorax sp. HJSM1_2]|uniref:sigma-54-dependent transcriptional regulator n=1 Tax=Variovorax sp. HJSM1_2 TaxID=3366263 RepID=UPI003BD88370